MKKEKVVEVVKVVLVTVAGLGVECLCSAFAGSVASSSNAGRLRKSLMALGGIVIGGMVASQTEKYIGTYVDNTVQQVDELVNMAKNASTTASEEAK